MDQAELEAVKDEAPETEEVKEEGAVIEVSSPLRRRPFTPTRSRAAPVLFVDPPGRASTGG